MRWASILLLLAACGSKKHAAEGHDAAVAKPTEHVVAKVGDAGVDAPPAKPARTEHTVWKLVDNRHTAHRSVDGGDLVIDATNAGFARYTRFGVPAMRWSLGASIGTERAALADKVAAIDVPIIPEQPQ